MTPSHAATPPDGAAPPRTTTIDYAPSDPSFSFPYTAYSIQQDLMQHLYQALARSQVTVIESPTGTGKSLSLISASLTFLRDAKHHARTSLIETIQAQVRADSGSKNEPDWVLEHEIQSRLKAWEREESELEERLEEIRKKEEELRRLMPSGAAQMGRRKRNRIDGDRGPDSKPSEDEFAPEPYYETEQDTHKVDDNGPDNFSPAVRAMLAKINGRGSTGPEQEEPDVQKIYFASRTHSQLSQFIAELRKTPFSRSTPIPDAPEGSPTSIPPIRVIPLGSRQNLCINDEVRNKSNGSNEVLGDLCLELQKGSTEEKRCPYLPPMSEPTKLNEFRDRALTLVGDIEDIEDLGRRTKTCPYYGSRKAVRSAQLVTLPYNMLMSKAAREALGVSVKDHVIIVDEAHNLIDSILQLHSVSITTSQITSIRAALLTYITKFKTRLNGANAAYLRQLALLLRGLAEYAMSWANEGVKGKKKEEMVGVNALFQSRGGAVGGGKGAIDQVNLFKLDHYLKTSKIARKIGGYVDSLAEETTAAGRQAVRTNATRNLQRIQEFILSLASSEKDGRILLSTEPKPVQAGQVRPEKMEVTLKYMLLAPSESFKDVAEEAKSVVLAGGTMEPMSDFRDQLFPYLPSERFSTFSCGHVVPPDHIACFAVSKGPTGESLEFKFDRRKDEKLLDELGQSIVNLTNVIPHGIVVFVPSYNFLFHIQARWEKTNLITRLGSRKKVFWEPKSSSEVDLILRDYSAAITTPPSKGAILFAVVGAKLSEGINFANEMARAVIICGIPYPNAQSTELKERMNFLKATTPKDSKIDPGQVLCKIFIPSDQNLAFRAVNQSIGRAIRNSTDWAAIILLDARYQQVSKQIQLPHWLGQDVRNVDGFGQLMKEVVGFVKRRKGVEG